MRLYHKFTILFLVLSVIPLLVIGSISLYTAEKSLEKEVCSNLNNTAVAGVDEIERFFAERRANLIILKKRNVIQHYLPALEQYGNDRLHPSFIEAKKTLDAQLVPFQNEYCYTNILLLNNEGKELYASSPEHNLTELKKYTHSLDTAAFQKNKNRDYSGEVLKTTCKEHPYIMVMAGALYDANNTSMGSVCLVVNIGKVHTAMMNKAGLGKSGEVLLVKKTPDNKILFISPLKYAPDAALNKIVTIGSNEALPAQRAVAGESGIGRSIDYRGKKVLSAWRPIPSLGWGFVAKIGEEEAFLSVAHFRYLLIVAVMVVLFSIIVAVFTTAKSIANPIARLCKGAEIIGGGNFNHIIGIDANDEVGQLSRAFDAMTANLKNTTTSIEYLNKEIIERKQAEEKLCWKTAFLEAQIESSPDGILVVDSDSKRIFTNKRFFDHMKVPDEISRQSDDAPLLQHVVSMVKDTEQFLAKVSYLYKHPDEKSSDEVELKDGTIFDRYTSGVFGEGGKYYGRIWNFRDITDRKRTEEAIRTSEARMRAITDSAQDAILMMDTEGRVSYWNPAAERILGYTNTEAIGKNLHSFIVPQRYCQTHHAAFPAFRQTGKGAGIGKTLDLEAMRKDGTEISVQLSLSAVQINGGWHAVGILRDVTERKQAEELLQKTNQRLEEQDKLKSELIDTVSHEMRTPLCIFKNIISNAAAGALGEVSQKLKENLTVADREICRLSKIISDFVDIAEIDRGIVTWRTKQFAMQSAVAKAIRLLTPHAAEKNIRLTVVAPDSELLLDADHNRVVQVLTNLISNAIKFTHVDGQVVVRLREIENEISVEVEDNGIGIAVDDISKVFSRFVQIEKQVGVGEHGIGLGLSITKAIIEMHGGRIWVESTPGQGTIFCFTLPKKSVQNPVTNDEAMCRQA